MSDIAGITIGPIIETISNAPSPAALWFASYFFSDITRRICEKIYHSDSFQNTTIYAPYYSIEDTDHDGVGKYNDRIIFKAEQVTKDALDRIITDVKKESINCFQPSIIAPGAEKYLEEYLQIPFVILPYREDRTVDDIYSYLDILELMRTVPADDRFDPFSSIFKGEENYRNKYVRNSGLFKKIDQENNQLQNFAADKHIWRIEEIAAQRDALLDHTDGRTENCKTRNGKKWPHYYAVVSADGDRLGETVKQSDFESNDKEKSRVVLFNKACKENAKQAAVKIRSYGGMTIYAGGDDLLFIAPIVGTDGSNIFSLCDSLNHSFCKNMEKSGFKNMSMSFGTSIQYYKFPLYEALEKSRELQDKAKKYGRNATALSLRKHSGQSIGFIYHNECSKAVQDMIDFGDANGMYNNDEATVITAISKTILKYKPLEQILFNHACRPIMAEDSFIKKWLNSFDNPKQSVDNENGSDAAPSGDDAGGKGTGRNLYAEAGKMFYRHFIMNPVKMSVFTDEDRSTRLTEDSILSFTALLEFRKFMREKEGER